MRLYKSAVVAPLFAISCVAQAVDPAGKTMIARGNVQAYEDVANSRKLKRRAPIFNVDTVETADKSKAQFRMRDGTLLALKENSKLLISEYQYNDAEGGGSAVMELVEGGLRSVTGAIKSNNGTYELKTPVGSIGIRGTHYEIEIIQGEVFIAVWDGAVDVNVDVGVGDQTVSLGDGEDFSYATITEEGEVTELLEPPANFNQGHSDDPAQNQGTDENSEEEGSTTTEEDSSSNNEEGSGSSTEEETASTSEESSSSTSEEDSSTQNEDSSTQNEDSSTQSEGSSSQNEDSSTQSGDSSTQSQESTQEGSANSSDSSSSTNQDASDTSQGETSQGTGTSGDNTAGTGTTTDTGGTPPATNPDSTTGTPETTTPDTTTPDSTTPDTSTTDTGPTVDTTISTGDTPTPDLETTPTTDDTGVGTVESPIDDVTEDQQEERIEQVANENTRVGVAVIEQRTGVANFSNLTSFSLSDSLNPRNLTISIVVDFDDVGRSEGELNLDDDGGHWNGLFEGIVVDTDLELDFTALTYGNEGVEGSVINADIDASDISAFFANNGDVLNGNFRLVQGVNGHQVSGNFILGEN